MTEMSKILCSSSFALDSAHEQFDVLTRPKINFNTSAKIEMVKKYLIDVRSLTAVAALVC